MTRRFLAAILSTSLFASSLVPVARAENQMGYRLLTQDEAAGLPHNHGGLGLSVQRADQITDGGLTFDIMRISQVRPNSPGAQAGLKPGDQIIAVDGRVFQSLIAFAGYIGSMSPGARATVDYIPANGGPAQAQRVAVMIAPRPGQPAPPPPEGGMSTGTKIAIGVGAAALIGCYELGCFSHRAAARPPTPPGQPQPTR